LPSPAAQRARQAALPPADDLARRLVDATAGGPLPAARLQAFIADVQAQRVLAPLTSADLAGTPLASALSAQLVTAATSPPLPAAAGASRSQGDVRGRAASSAAATDASPPRWTALLTLQLADATPGAPEARPADAAELRQRLQQALDGLPATRLVQIQPELAALYAHYLVEARWQASLGALVVLALLAWHLKNLRRLARLTLPLVVSVVLVLGGLTLAGQALGVLHLVGLLLVVAVGSNYALFFDHLHHDPAAAKAAASAGADTEAGSDETIASLALANMTTVVSFGLLATSSVGALSAMGLVVAPGALLTLLVSAAFMAPRRRGPGCAPHGRQA
jgi:predicted exporter